MIFARIKRTASLIAIATFAVLVSGWLCAPSADASATMIEPSEAHVINSINQHRVDAGLPPLQRDASLTASAGEWTTHMATGSFLGHAASDALRAGAPSGWEKLGENVGRGSSVESVVQAFMRSATHRSNILDPSFTHVGAGLVVHPWGQVYTTLRFASIPDVPETPAATPVIPAGPSAGAHQGPSATIPVSPATPPAPAQDVPLASIPPAVVASIESRPVDTDTPLALGAVKPRETRRVGSGSDTMTRSIPTDEVSSTVVRGSRRGVD